MGSGESMGGTISSGDVDMFKVYVPSGSNYTFTASLANVSGWTPALEILAGKPGSSPGSVTSGTGTSLSTGVGGGHGEPKSDQWFYVKVSKDSGSAPVPQYDISVKLVDDSSGKETRPDWPPAGTPYNVPFDWGEAVAGYLDSGTDVDSFEVDLDACEDLTIDTAGISGSGDTMLKVYAPDDLWHFEGQPILWNDDGGAEGGTNGKADHVHLRAPMTGTYRIDVVSADGAKVEGYRLYLAKGRDTGGHCTHPAF